jgi:hypothetical protein
LKEQNRAAMKTALSFLSCRLPKNVARSSVCPVVELPHECIRTIVEFAAIEVVRESMLYSTRVTGHPWGDPMGEQTMTFRYGRLLAIEQLRDVTLPMIGGLQTELCKWTVTHGGSSPFLRTYMPDAKTESIDFYTIGDADVLRCQKRNRSSRSEWVYHILSGRWTCFPLPTASSSNACLMYLFGLIEKAYAVHPRKSALLEVIRLIWWPVVKVRGQLTASERPNYVHE